MYETLSLLSLKLYPDSATDALVPEDCAVPKAQTWPRSFLGVAAIARHDWSWGGNRLLALLTNFGSRVPNVLSDKIGRGAFNDFGGREHAHVEVNLTHLPRCGCLAGA